MNFILCIIYNLYEEDIYFLSNVLYILLVLSSMPM